MRRGTAVLAAALMSGCVTMTGSNYRGDLAAMPRSILVLPPANASVETAARERYLEGVSRPLIERGYYVFPVAVVDRFLQDNGVPRGAEGQVSPGKLREVFGCDAVLYTRIQEWGSSYVVIDSIATVELAWTLVEARSGLVLWTEARKLSGSAQRGNSGNSLLGAVLQAAVAQVSENNTERSAELSGEASRAAFASLPLGPLAAVPRR
jgi:hypothetical protein